MYAYFLARMGQRLKNLQSLLDRGEWRTNAAAVDLRQAKGTSEERRVLVPRTGWQSVVTYIACMERVSAAKIPFCKA